MEETEEGQVGDITPTKREVEKGPEQQILIVTDKGFATRTKLSEFRVSHRGTKGTRAMFLNEKNGNPVATKMVDDDDLVFVITKLGQGGLVAVSEIKLMGRGKSGVKLMSLDEGDEVVAIL